MPKIPVSLAVGVPLLLFVYVHFESHIMHWRISVGMPEAEISSKFGIPDRHEDTMLFCDEIFSWSGDCPENSYHEYQFFRTGIDRWVVIGFDDKGQVAFKTMGSL